MNKQEIEKAIEVLRGIYPSQKAIKTGEYDHVADALDDAISSLEHQLTNGWISVSESLPEENIDGITDDFLPYNVSLKFKYGECVRTYQFGQGRWWKNGDDMTAYVIAWQPLPPKYKEVSDG